ncbi:MAG: hypothetical protein NXI10_04680 [bacterium]|nr:hypothetical protein [bacterium]
MKEIRFIFLSVFILSATTACNEPTVEEEIDDVCECIKAAESESDRDVCFKMMQRITDKYAFDPDAADDIKKRLDECAPN